MSVQDSNEDSKDAQIAEEIHKQMIETGEETISWEEMEKRLGWDQL